MSYLNFYSFDHTFAIFWTDPIVLAAFALSVVSHVAFVPHHGIRDQKLETKLFGSSKTMLCNLQGAKSPLFPTEPPTTHVVPT